MRTPRPTDRRSPKTKALTIAVLAMGVGAVFALTAAGWSPPRMVERAEATTLAVDSTGLGLGEGQRRSTLLVNVAFGLAGFDLDTVASGQTEVPRVFLDSFPADLAEIDLQEVRKSVFLRTMLPIILQVNEAVLVDRRRLVAMDERVKGGEPLSPGDQEWLQGLANEYKCDPDLRDLLRRVDAVPPSLALAQAIEESGWGTSRLAQEGNAPFGQWGVDPAEGWRPALFDSLSEAVWAYAFNLNTHQAYARLRQAREQARAKGQTPDGAALAGTIQRYSERGEGYIQSVRTLIRVNDLGVFDAARLDHRPVTALLAGPAYETASER